MDPPAAPLRLLDHLKSLVKSGNLMAPLTPDVIKIKDFFLKNKSNLSLLSQLHHLEPQLSPHHHQCPQLLSSTVSMRCLGCKDLCILHHISTRGLGRECSCLKQLILSNHINRMREGQSDCLIRGISSISLSRTECLVQM